MNLAEKEKALENQATLHYHIMDWSEDELIEVIEAEQDDKKRIGYLLRVYSRLSKIRKTRERGELRMGMLDSETDATGKPELTLLVALLDEQDGKRREGVLKSLYSPYHNLRRNRELLSLSNFEFGV